MLKAATGLEGGVVARGSTCGVVTGGVLGIALNWEDEIRRNGVAAEEGIIGNARDYIRWFEQNFGTTRCSERSGVDWYAPGGQIQYFFPAVGLARCLFHIGCAAEKLSSYRSVPLPQMRGTAGNGMHHCARSVLEKVRMRTGVGDALLETVSFVLDGGVAYTGGACGALAGAVMAVNLVHGLAVRQQRYWKTIDAFITGHLNLLRTAPRGMPEPFGIGREITETFIKAAGSIDCSAITGIAFDDGASFRNYMHSQKRCVRLMEVATDAAVAALQQWK